MSTDTAAPEQRRSKQKEESAKAVQPLVESKVRSRVRPGMLAGALALIIAAALGVAWLVNSSGNNITVFSASKDITRGAIVQASDLTTVQIPANQPIPALSASNASDVIGKTAAVDIPQGTLLSQNNTTSDTGLQAGNSIVGISLTSAQLPPYPLKAGDQVRIVDTPINQGEPPKETPNSIKATVITSKTDSVSGKTTVAVEVLEAKAPDLAARAATGRVALILDSLKG